MSSTITSPFDEIEAAYAERDAQVENDWRADLALLTGPLPLSPAAEASWSALEDVHEAELVQGENAALRAAWPFS